jgi:hypothetical protein
MFNYLSSLVAQWQTRGRSRSGSHDAWLVRCPCGQWGVPMEQEANAWLAICRHLFPQLDQELDNWEYAHGWLYR